MARLYGHAIFRITHLTLAVYLRLMVDQRVYRTLKGLRERLHLDVVLSCKMAELGQCLVDPHVVVLLGRSVVFEIRTESLVRN